MKKLPLILCLLLLPTFSYAGGGMMLGIVGGGTPAAAPSCAGVNTYYGDNDNVGDLNLGGYTVWNHDHTITVTTGGTICAITTVVRRSSAGSPTVRMAVYSADGTTLICQCDAAITLSNDAFAEQSCAYPHLTGTCTVLSATNYTIAVTASAITNIRGDAGQTNGAIQYNNTDYSAGFPASLPAGTDYTYHFDARIGVQ